MAYIKFDDACALICEICHSTTMEEKMLLARLGTDMYNNNDFAKAYTSFIQKEYMEYLKQKNSNTYNQWYFKELDEKVRQEIKQNKKIKEAALLPKNLKDKRDDKDQTSRLLAKIVSIRKNMASV